MDVTVEKVAAGNYNVLRGRIVLGRIEKLSDGWAGYDKHIGTFQGEDDYRHKTFSDASLAAHAYYGAKDYCHGGCGEIVSSCYGAYCPLCNPRRYSSDTVTDSITGGMADCMEYGDAL
jgi:hypothetical protein